MAATKTETKTDPNQQVHQNMRFYGLVQNTPIEATKQIGAGRLKGYTDINPMWRIKKLTEVFGPAGFGWWTQNEKYTLSPAEGTNEVACFCEIELVVVDPETKQVSHPIKGIGGNKFIASERNGLYCNDEAYKMAYTDALSIACKSLGFSHDIYFSKDRTKYSLAEDVAEAKTAKQTKQSDDEMLPLNEVINELTVKFNAITSTMDDAKKNELAKWIESRIGMMNYKKCTDVIALNNLLKEINKPKAA